MEGNEAAERSGGNSGRSSGGSPSTSDSPLDRNPKRKRRRLGSDSPAAKAPAPAQHSDLPLALSKPVRTARLRSFDFHSCAMPARKSKSGKKNRRGSGRASLSKILSSDHRTSDEGSHLRRSTRNRRMSVFYDYSDEDDDEIVGQTYRSKSDELVVRKKAVSEKKVSEGERPRREGLRPRSNTVSRLEESSQESAGDNETSDEDAEVEEDGEEESETGDEEDEGDDGIGEEENEAAVAEEDGEEELEERDDGKRRYELRDRTEAQRVSSPQKGSLPETEGKRTRENSRPRPRKRRRREQDDSDDSLLVDEMDQAPGISWARGARGPNPFLPATLDMHGSTNWGLGIAASGWGHQGDFWGFGLAGPGTQTAGPSSKGGADIQPVQVDETVSFDQVGGLSQYIDSLKEMVFFPLLYPKFFECYRITPPRGVLLCGPPGTGKTLVARALASAASKAGQKVNFYMRKGADVLSKWVGEAERQLRMLFEEAQRCQPSIIFFDEIDGLAPVRSSKSEQIHNSIVSTLLALMDGLDSRGQVVVIGATNRIDAIDGALRRPGRFDREFIFPLPDSNARAEILDIHTKGWHSRPSPELRKELATTCVGYCGADLKALCTEAAIRAFRERYPEVYTSDEQFVIDADSIKVQRSHFQEAMSAITPAAHRGATVHSRPLPAMLAPCLQSQLQAVITELVSIFPFASKNSEDGGPEALSKLFGVQASTMFPTVYKPRYLLCGGDGSGLEHLGPALLHKLERFPVHSLGLPSLLSDPSAKTPEEALVHIFGEARRNTPSILYLPQLHLWWESAHEQLRTVLLMLLTDLPSNLPLLLFGTSSVPKNDLDEEVQSIFGHHIHEVDVPSREEKEQFFSQMIHSFLAISTQQLCDRPKKPVHASLPKAPKVDKGPSEAELRAQAEAEEHAIRRLRMCLRDVCNRLFYEKRFSIFHFPVEAEEAPNYYTVVQKPMDISTLLERVDKGHYKTRSAFLEDAELIPANAKQYHGEDYHTANRIVSRAFALFDAVQGMLSQMDPELVAFCDRIASKSSGVSVAPANTAGEQPEQPATSERLRGIQPDLNLPATYIDAQNKSTQPVDESIANGIDETEAAPASRAGDTDERLHAVEKQTVTDLQAKFLLKTDEFTVSQLEMLYARLCGTLRVQLGSRMSKSAILQALLSFVEDERNFHL